MQEYTKEMKRMTKITILGEINYTLAYQGYYEIKRTTKTEKNGCRDKPKLYGMIMINVFKNASDL